MDGGAGFDSVAYFLRQNVLVDLGRGVATTGTASDRLISIEGASGGSGRDRLIGDAGPNSLDGRGGDDVLLGREGDDRLAGDGPQDDYVGGPTGLDRLVGGAGNDQLDGGPLRDLLDGGLGDDRLIGDGDLEPFECGGGRDTATLGRSSILSPDCELLQLDRSTAPAQFARVSRRRATLPVRCEAAQTRCRRITVVLKAGRRTLGRTAISNVPRGGLRRVPVRLSTGWRRAFARRGGLVIQVFYDGTADLPDYTWRLRH